MKKLRIIVAAILRVFAVLLPGIFTGFALWKIHGALVTILAALGVEFVWAVILAYLVAVAAQIKTYLSKKKEPAQEPE